MSEKLDPSKIKKLTIVINRVPDGTFPSTTPRTGVCNSAVDVSRSRRALLELSAWRWRYGDCHDFDLIFAVVDVMAGAIHE